MNPDLDVGFAPVVLPLLLEHLLDLVGNSDLLNQLAHLAAKEELLVGSIFSKTKKYLKNNQ